jgi:hypothetical protein
MRDGDSQSVQVGPASDSRGTTTTTEPTETTYDGTDPTVDPADVDFAWPAVEQVGRFDSPEEVARVFAHEYLGIVGPLDQQEDPEAAVRRYVIRPRPEGGGRPSEDGPRTVLDVARMAVGDPAEPHWFVISAESPDIEVTAPEPTTELSSSFRVTGRARNLYEGTVIVEVRPDGPQDAPVITVPGTASGSGPEFADFSVEIPFEGLPGGRGAIVVKTDSGVGDTPEATVVPVTFAPAPPSATTELRVYVIDGRGDFVPATRQVPRTEGVLRAALEQLLAGTTPEEEARGLRSPFDGDAGMLLGVTITEGRTAIVDLDARFPQAVDGDSGAEVLASLDHTVFQFPSVLRVAYHLDGQCGTFAGIDTDLLCEPRTRDEY